MANPVVGQANDGFVLDAPFDVEFTNTFQNAGYFLKTGAGKFLTKPFDRNEVRQEISALLS